METESRSVSAARLKIVRADDRLTRWARMLLTNELTVQDLIANPPQESIVVPLDWPFWSDDIVIQYHLRLSTIERFYSASGPYMRGYPHFVMRVVMRDQSGRLIVIESGPLNLRINIVGIQNISGGDRSPGLYWTSSAQWHDVMIVVSSESVTAWRGDKAIFNYNIRAYSSAKRKIEAIIIAEDQEYSVANSDFMIGEIRVWEGLGYAARESLNTLRGMRLDGREPHLAGYWKLGEGQGTRIEDSSRYGHHGTLMGGSWVSAADSGLTLDCAREIGCEKINESLEEISQQLKAIRLADEDVAKLTQEKQRLNTHIGQIKANQKTLEDQLNRDLQTRAAALQKLEDDYRAWQDDIKDGGKVAVSTFSNTIAQEIDSVTQRLNTAQSPYSLQGVALEVKALPVAGEDDTGMRLRFPAMDDQKVQSDQLSTLRMSFATRPSVPVRPRAAVPDVRGHTEALARRQLGAAGFRVQALDQAAISEEEIGRVVSQVPSPDVLAEPDKIVRVFVGRPSGMSAPEKETQG